MKRIDICLVAGLCPIALVVAGCHHPTVQPMMPVAYDAYPAEVAASTPTPAPRATTVHVSEDILAACRIKDATKGEEPRFAFDSSALSHEDRHLLGEVAHCFTAGPLAGRSVALVGRADPRGTEAYNMGLGDRRAESVETYLEHQGMVATKLSLTSRGALDATGHDESGWAKDRRVDVNLAM